MSDAVNRNVFIVIFALFVMLMGHDLATSSTWAIYTNEYTCSDERIVNHRVECFEYTRKP